MKKMKYSAALEELEQIVQDVENAETAVDELAEKVKRASELIQLCNDILKKTDKEVNDILKSMDEKGEKSD